MKLLVVGRIGRAHGLRGDITVSSFNPDSDIWRAGRRLRVLRDVAADTTVDVPDDAPVVVVLGARRGPKGRWALRLDGVADRSAAEELQGAALAIELGELEEPGDDEFYYYEVVGWAVESTDGRPIGTVVRALSTHIDLLEVRPTGGGETCFIPMIDDVVRQVDRAGRRVVIEPLEGLLP